VREIGKPIAEVARHLGINAGTLGNWVNADKRRRVDGSGGLDEDERAEPVRLRENAGSREPRPESGHKIAIGLTGEPVATDRRSGAITHRKDHCRNSAHIGARTERSR